MTGFAEELIAVWKHYDKARKPDDIRYTNEELFRLNLDEAAKVIFGDIAKLLVWDVNRLFGRLKARADIPGHDTFLVYEADITGLYKFTAKRLDCEGRVSSCTLDGRLLLGALLNEEEW